jgi:hypothetical protein
MTNPNDKDSNKQTYSAVGGGSGGRQGIGAAFLMSMVRQIARSIGAVLVRAVLGGGRR